MAKPIFVVNIPINAFQSTEAANKYIDGLVKELNDYHVLTIFDGTSIDLRFRMFSDKLIEPIELEKLKEELNLVPSKRQPEPEQFFPGPPTRG